MDLGLSTTLMSATSVSATAPPLEVFSTMPSTLSRVSYSPSGYSTLTSMLSPSTSISVALTPLIRPETALPIWAAVMPAALAFRASTWISRTGDPLVVLEVTRATSLLFFKASVTFPATSFTSS